jgi:hypothetical protein
MSHRGSSSRTCTSSLQLRSLSPIEGMHTGAHTSSRNNESPCLQFCSRQASPSPSQEQHPDEPEYHYDASAHAAEFHEVGDLMNASASHSFPLHRVIDSDVTAVTTPKHCHRTTSKERFEPSPPCSGALSPPVSDAGGEWKICGPQETEADAFAPVHHDTSPIVSVSGFESGMHSVPAACMQSMPSSSHDERGSSHCVETPGVDMDSTNMENADENALLVHSNTQASDQLDTTESTATSDTVRFFIASRAPFLACSS